MTRFIEIVEAGTFLKRLINVECIEQVKDMGISKSTQIFLRGNGTDGCVMIPVVETYEEIEVLLLTKTTKDEHVEEYIPCIECNHKTPSIYSISSDKGKLCPVCADVFLIERECEIERLVEENNKLCDQITELKKIIKEKK